jgi:hypothetical protein
MDDTRGYGGVWPRRRSMMVATEYGCCWIRLGEGGDQQSNRRQNKKRTETRLRLYRVYDGEVP